MSSQHHHRNWPDDERLADLMSQHATEGLDADERVELQRRLADEQSVDGDAAELAAAAADLAFIQEAGVEPMPADLARKLIDLGEREMADRRADPAPKPIAIDPPAASWTQRTGTIGWSAAAAALILAVGLYLAGQPQVADPTNAVARRQLLTEAADTITVEWAVKTDDFADVTGDVVWSDSRQAGYMRLKGMPVNDPSQSQYQLWIVDPDRDERPVDGGVFDVTRADMNEAGEVIIPIDAKLAIDKPAAFAITVEKPGGVVKSAGPLHVVAPVKS